MVTSVKDFIEHHGTKGMRWGVRTKSGGGSVVRKLSADHKKIAALKGKKVSELSDKQLREVIGRMNMERQMSGLNPSKIKQGHNGVKAAIAAVGTVNAIFLIAASPVGKKVGKAIANANKGVSVGQVISLKPKSAFKVAEKAMRLKG
jgi:hypothetical protein